MVEFLQRACRVARDRARETGASIGITVDAGVIISNRSCLALAASTRDLLFCTAGSLMRESRDTRDRKPPPFRGTTRFFYRTLSLCRDAGFDG